MLKLYAKTRTIRATCTQEARIVLDKDEDAPAGSLRRVQVLIPAAPKCYLAIDAVPEGIGPNRTYKLPTAAAGAAIVFHLLPDQWIVCAAHESYAEISLIVEHISET